MKKILETGILLFAVMGFWGMIYPDLCFISDVCSVGYGYGGIRMPLEGEECGEMQDGYGMPGGYGTQDGYGMPGGYGTQDSYGMPGTDCAGTGTGTADAGGGQEPGGWQPDIYTRICEAKPGQIRVKSRLLEWLHE